MSSGRALCATLIGIALATAGCEADDAGTASGGGGEGGGGVTGGGGAGGGALGPPTIGGLVIEEVFYAGSPGLMAHTFADQFIDIRNDSDGLVFADGLLVGDAYGAAGEINPGQPVSPFADDAEHVYLGNLFRVPGDGDDVPLLPGETLTIAHDGTNHQPDSILDLSGADFEAYIESSGNDDDWPTVDNLEVVHFTGGYDWLMPVFGPGVVIARMDATTIELVEHPDFPGEKLVKIPVSAVVDGVEALMDSRSSAYKRLPAGVDASFAFVSDTYTGESIARRRGVEGSIPLLLDSGSSAADFDLVAAPRPGE
ncbi:MAG: DUF4876 domain-containing protein [Myxococcales bacterium]|nr:DUF4876 domain-containing protein [Myxococcales bacterium]